MRSSSRKRNEPLFEPAANKLYIALFKPYNVLSQFTEEPNSDKRTLADFELPEDVYPIGRLDADSEGLLLLSDDARLNNRLLNPSFAHERTYLVQVENVPRKEAIEKLRRGVRLKDGMTKPAKATVLADQPQLPERNPPIRERKHIPTSWIELTITEGRNRQVRRMTAAVEHPTLRLVRRAIGSLDLFELGLTPGQWLMLPHDKLMLVFARTFSS